LDELEHEVNALLFERGRSGAVLVFSAVSGIYVAYVTAQGFGLGDRIGFAGAALAVLLVGAVWGLVALYFAGGLLSWSAETLRGDTETERMYAVFGYATWPFLPLLAVIVPLEFAAYDTTLFAEERPEASALLVWGVNALELATIGLWLLLMVKGTALAARLSQVAAAETVVLSLVEMSVIAVLLLVILVVSFMI
ncbi:MAG: hypothetical protein HYV94_22585, partial [Candidatus Rokubacteria bacterium]|nr:hypothetical protein [Candidatus Rokubacteria bacterium]